MTRDFQILLRDITACTRCAEHLPLGPRPVVQADPRARILIAGQAPGMRVHNTGIPFNDPSGDRLRDWMGIHKETFYDPAQIALIPMGFCYPGTGKAGDLPPRPECAPAWRQPLLDALPHIKLTLVIGQYAQKWHLDKPATVTEAVAAWRQYAPAVVPLPHPSPRNNLWLKKNPWFLEDLIPELRARVHAALAADKLA